MYPSDLNNLEWTLVQAYFPKRQKIGRPRKHSFRWLLNGIFYILRAGCSWKMMPKEFPPWKTVYHYFRKWTLNGLLFSIQSRLLKRLRKRKGRPELPSAAIIDAQSVKCFSQSGVRGYDGAKRIKGRKRHILVDTCGHLLSILVESAQPHDSQGGRRLLEQSLPLFPTLEKIWGDSAYLSLCKDFPPLLEIVRRKKEEKGFVVQPKRWIVERSFAWFGNFRRFARDYEKKTETTESMFYVASIRLILSQWSQLSNYDQ